MDKLTKRVEQAADFFWTVTWNLGLPALVIYSIYRGCTGS